MFCRVVVAAFAVIGQAIHHLAIGHMSWAGRADDPLQLVSQALKPGNAPFDVAKVTFNHCISLAAGQVRPRPQIQKLSNIRKRQTEIATMPDEFQSAAVVPRIETVIASGAGRLSKQPRVLVIADGRHLGARGAGEIANAPTFQSVHLLNL
jgi:hypothetical protein